MRFDQLIISIRNQVNNDISEIVLPESPKYLYDPIRFTLNGSGKRFRPILVHLLGRLMNADQKSISKIAIAVELVHNFTLIHDDIMDNDEMRHGQLTVHSKWDKSTAILAGDGIFAMAQILLCSIEIQTKFICQFFNQTTLEVCEGQALDKEFENDIKIRENEYLTMVEKKTGALLGACAALPAILMNRTSKMVGKLSEFGRAVGKGFQLHDDLLEIYGDPKEMGKSLGSDIKEGKQTYMVIKARKNFPRKWDQIIKDESSENGLEKFRDFFHSNGIKKETENLAKKYFNLARDAIKSIEFENEKDLFMFIDLIENRKF